MNMNSEAKELRREYLQICDKYYDPACSGANKNDLKKKKDEILKKMLDICDDRVFCVVTNESLPCVRHIFRVDEQAENHLEEIKEEYYKTYAKIPDDNFWFFRGLHRAQDYADKFVIGEAD